MRKLISLPALIDPHVHFRVPGAEHKEDWKTASLACVRGGITTVCEMPNNTPACMTIERMEAKKKVIDAQLKVVDMPLRYNLYLGADKNHLDEIEKAPGEACAIKVFMGSTTGDLLVDDDEALDAVFKRAAAAQMLVAVHAEEEAILQERYAQFAGATDPAIHSTIRSPEAAVAATKKAIALSEKYGCRLYILHMSTKEEVELVRQAKKRGVPVFAEATTHHLFLTIDDYEKWGTRVQMNPPLRTLADQEALWEGIHDGTIDTIGTDHAPHTLEEKGQPFGKAPSGIPGVETLLPLLLDAVHRGKLSLEQLVRLTRTNPQKILGLPDNDDRVIVDLGLTKTVKDEDLLSKCGWTAYAGRELTGWPVCTCVDGRDYFNQLGAQERLQVEVYQPEVPANAFAGE